MIEKTRYLARSVSKTPKASSLSTDVFRFSSIAKRQIHSSELLWSKYYGLFQIHICFWKKCFQKPWTFLSICVFHKALAKLVRNLYRSLLSFKSFFLSYR